jgi:hypothetical protein
MQRWMRSSIVPAQMNLWTCRADDLRLPFPRRLNGSGLGASPPEHHGFAEHSGVQYRYQPMSP